MGMPGIQVGRGMMGLFMGRVLGRALSFDEVDDYVDVENWASHNPISSITI